MYLGEDQSRNVDAVARELGEDGLAEVRHDGLRASKDLERRVLLLWSGVPSQC